MWGMEDGGGPGERFLGTNSRVRYYECPGSVVRWNLHVPVDLWLGAVENAE